MSQDNGGIEATVYYILARSFAPSPADSSSTSIDHTLELGLPAYDISKSLIGFYRQGEDFGVTIPMFTPASNLQSILQEKHYVKLLQSLTECLKQNDQCVFSLQKYTSFFDMANEAIIYDMCNSFTGFEA